MERIGITTTIPIEVLYSAGVIPVDLNNVFITSNKRLDLVKQAEIAGYPRQTCTWIKGIYAICLQQQIKKVIAVTQGDCSNTHALMETLQLEGIEIIPFAYPYDRDRRMLELEVDKLIEYLKTNRKKVSETKHYLDYIRNKVKIIDELTIQEDKVTGYENHFFQVNCSDFKGNPTCFEREIDEFINECKKKGEIKKKIRLGYIGVPPIYDNLYEYIESFDCHIVYNEIQRQFSMPFKTSDIITQYQMYTYPYGVFGRIKDIKEQITLRKIDGLIHFVQSFCFRQIEDMIIRRKLKLPILTIEGEEPTSLDARTKLRIESFINMLTF
ncbi:MAG: 2-hydroxyacyl-CoA dehydratase [bacterium]